MHPYTQKHRPKAFKDIIGQSLSATALRDFIVNFKSHKKNSALIYGPSGTGKTCSVYAIASDVTIL